MQIDREHEPLPTMRKRRNRRPYPEKGLVAGLQATGEKLSVVGTQAMREDELSEEAMDSFRVLVEQANDFLRRIDQVHKGEPDPAVTRPKRRTLPAH